MFGLSIMMASTFFREIANSIGKEEVARHKESIFTMGFLNMFWLVAGFSIIALVRPSFFIFSLASIPTLIIRIISEIAQAHVTMLAVANAERSTYGFLRVLTLPLLLIVDIVLGYRIDAMQFAGISVIIVALGFLFLNHGITKKGAAYTIFTAFNSVICVSLYKYHITQFNSVVAEQLIVGMCILWYFVLTAHHFAHEHPLKFLTKKVFFIQSGTSGFASALESFAFLFAPASIIISAKRSLVVMWSFLSGQKIFHEKASLSKWFGFSVLICGIILLGL